MTKNMDIGERKRVEREHVLRLRRKLTSEEVAASSEAIRRRILTLAVWQRAKTIHTFVGALPGEVRTDRLIAWSLEHGRSVLVPVVGPQPRTLRHVRLERLADLRRTSWGGLEPVGGTAVDPKIADIIIVPGVAFDRECNRLGMGGGFYDRFLASVGVPTVGVAHACQIVPEVPVDKNDVAVSLVVTPDEVIERSNARPRSSNRA